MRLISQSFHSPSGDSIRESFFMPAGIISNENFPKIKLSNTQLKCFNLYFVAKQDKPHPQPCVNHLTFSSLAINIEIFSLQLRCQLSQNITIFFIWFLTRFIQKHALPYIRTFLIYFIYGTNRITKQSNTLFPSRLFDYTRTTKTISSSYHKLPQNEYIQTFLLSSHKSHKLPSNFYFMWYAESLITVSQSRRFQNLNEPINFDCDVFLRHHKLKLQINR